MAWTWQIIPNFAKLSDFVANCAQFWKFYRDFIIPRENNAMVWRVLSQNPRKKRAKKKKLLQRSKTTELTWEFPRPIAPFLFPFFFFLSFANYVIGSHRNVIVTRTSFPRTIVPLVFNWSFSNDIAIELRHQWNFLSPPFSRDIVYKADALWTSFPSNNRGNTTPDFSCTSKWNRRGKIRFVAHVQSIFIRHSFGWRCFDWFFAYHIVAEILTIFI